MSWRDPHGCGPARDATSRAALAFLRGALQSLAFVTAYVCSGFVVVHALWALGWLS